MAYREPEKLLDSEDDFLAYMQLPSGAVTGNGTFYTPIFETVIVNKLGNYNPTTGVYTASLTGLYTFCYSICFNGNNSDVFYHIYASGSVFSSCSLVEFSPSSEANSIFSRSFTVFMTAGDTMSIEVMSSGSTSDNIQLYGQNPQSGLGTIILPTIFSGRKIY